VRAIGKARDKVTLARFIYGLGIPHVGHAVAADLAAEFGSVEALSKADEDDLLAMEGFGETMASAIVLWFSNPKNRRLLRAAREAGPGSARRPTGPPAPREDVCPHRRPGLHDAG
jgi:DNA ligase (NAD+)